MRNLSQDLRFAFRQLIHTPGFAITAILSLMLGIGATTAIFSVVYGVLLDPYPYKDAARMVHVELRDKNGRGPLLFVNGPQYLELRHVRAIDDVFLQQNRQQNLTGTEFPVSVQVGIYSPNLFEYMGVPLLAGRGFSSSDIVGNKSTVAVLSYLFWRRQYGADRGVIGKTMELDHALYTIIGIAPPRFTWGDSDVYLSATPTADAHDFWLSFIKLKPGTSYAAAASELQSLVDRFAKDNPATYPQNAHATIVTLNEEVLGKFAGTLVLLFGAVLALLVIGCANVSILLLARGTARQHELAVRVSVGATPGRLIRQLLTESILLSATGTALGVVAAYRGVSWLSTAIPFYSFPHEAAIHVSMPVLIFSAVVALVTGVLSGISPAWQLSRPQIAQVMQANSAKVFGGNRSRNTHRILIASQVALTLLLMAGAGAAMKAFAALTRTPLGFAPDNVLALNVAAPKGANTTWESRLNAQQAVLRALQDIPSVKSAAVSTTWFPPFGGFRGNIEIKSQPSLTGAEAHLSLVNPEIFSTLQIPLVSGRIFDSAEVMRSAHLAVVNQAFVRQFSGKDPIGQHVRSPRLKIELPDLLLASAPDDWMEIIGVVADAKNDGLRRPVAPALFLPYSFVLPPNQSLFVRVEGNPQAVTSSIRQRLRELNGEMVVTENHSLAWWLDTQGWGQERFIATLFSLFAVLALALAATGLFSVVSFAVTQRTQELGIRMALGAPRGSVIGLVLRSTVTMLAVGVGVGLALSIALGKVVASWTGGNSRDPLTLLVSGLLLFLVAALACIVPAWRAASIDPMHALRSE